MEFLLSFLPAEGSCGLLMTCEDILLHVECPCPILPCLVPCPAMPENICLRNKEASPWLCSTDWLQNLLTHSKQEF